MGVSTKFYRSAPDGVEAVEPQLWAEPVWRDWARGRDTAIERILSMSGPGRSARGGR